MPMLFRAAVSGAAVVAALTLASGTAKADCNADFSAMMSKRVNAITALNAISKQHGGKLDPVEACPKLRSLAAAEANVVSYMDKNKAWCGLPDDIVVKMTETHAKTEVYAAKACTFAVKMKQMQAAQQKQAQSQQQQQQEQAIRLPTGPL